MSIFSYQNLNLKKCSLKYVLIYFEGLFDMNQYLIKIMNGNYIFEED